MRSRGFEINYKRLSLWFYYKIQNKNRNSTKISQNQCFLIDVFFRLRFILCKGIPISSLPKCFIPDKKKH